MSTPRVAVPRGQTGAVSMWLLVIMILWLGTLALLYVTYSDTERILAAEQAARAEAAAKDARLDEEITGYNTLSAAVGFTDGSINARSNVEAIQTQADAARALLGTVLGGPDTTPTLESAITALTQAVQSARAAEAQAKADFDKELKARQAAEQNTTSVENNYKSQLANLQSQLADEQQRAADQAAADQARFDDLLAAQSDADQTARDAEASLSDFQAQAEKEKSGLEATLRALEVKRAPRAPEEPDGSVLAVGDSGGTAYIDLGRRDGLRPGTRFEVVRADASGELVGRGEVVVREVEDDMSLVGVLGKVSAFDPMLPGDQVRNPHFSKGESLRFFLLGDFPLAFSKQFVSERLQELGAAVDADLSSGTDVLVLGEKDMADEFAPDLTETEEYMLADRLGMRIMRLDDLAGFLRS